MAISTINIGNVVNDGLGDDLRTAFQKVNANFAELSASLVVTAENLSNVGEELLVANVANNTLNLRFKTLIAGSKITLDDVGTSVRINSTLSDAFTSITTDFETLDAATNPNISILGTENISVDGAIIDNQQIIVVDVKPFYDFGVINNVVTNPIQLALHASNIDFGTISNPSDLSLDLGTI